jgi:F-type H+-transporting ATPase subunit b
MLIDWFTVVAQALNFLILVWLLKRFLYKPILDAIDAREKRIATELADADAKKAEARQERDEFNRKNEEFSQQRAALLNTAEEEATNERQRLIAEARKESEVLRTKWQEALRSEHQSLSEEFTRRTREEVFAIARKTLADLASVSLEEQMTNVFIRRLHELSPSEKDELKSAFKAGSSPAIVRNTFHLPAAQRRAIEGAVTAVLAIETQVRFETDPDAVSGIELTANGYKVAWSIGDYLSSLKKNVDDLLKERPKPAAQAEAHSQQPGHEHRT